MKHDVLIMFVIGVSVLGAAQVSAIQPGPNVGDVVSIPMLSGGLKGLAIEAGGTTALVTEGSGELSRVDLVTGHATTIARVGNDIDGLAIEPGARTALVVTFLGLSRVNLATGAVTTILSQGLGGSGTGRAVAVAVEPGG